MLRGAIIGESLIPGSTIEGFGLVVTRLTRRELSDAPSWQPAVWTELVFECPDDQGDDLAARLAVVLAAPGWYANFYGASESFVIFPAKVFRYARGDVAGRAAAQAHGRANGIPETQLDWDD